MSWPAALPLAYLVGSVPTSILVGRLFFRTDIRRHGSGNAGASNAFRVFGTAAGLAVVAVDIGKGALAVATVGLFPSPAVVAPPVAAFLIGIAAVVGHVFSIFARFRGGKGVATAGGVLLALYPLSFAGALLVFLLALVCSGYTSLGSILAAVSFPFLTLAVSGLGVHDIPLFLRYLSVPLALFILFTHRSNIKRLLRGEENRFERIMILRRLFHRRRSS
ncbi:MAG: glycerol-3-phosphate 1-O-acyltransferase PlsY [Spirochaetota bacterium]